MNKYLGPSSRFGDGDGSFWDRWLTSTGYFMPNGNYAKADMPSSSMYSHGTVSVRCAHQTTENDVVEVGVSPNSRNSNDVSREMRHLQPGIGSQRTLPRYGNR